MCIKDPMLLVGFFAERMKRPTAETEHVEVLGYYYLRYCLWTLEALLAMQPGDYTAALHGVRKSARYVDCTAWWKYLE